LAFVALTIVVSSFGDIAAVRALYHWIIEHNTPSLDGIFR